MRLLDCDMIWFMIVESKDGTWVGVGLWDGTETGFGFWLGFGNGYHLLVLLGLYLY